MADTKEYFAEQVLRELQADFLGRDQKILPREVYPRLDAIVNQLARENFFENWKVGFGGVGEQFITTWEDVEVTDQTDAKPSFFTLPVVSYVDLPRNGGLYEIIPLDNAEKMVIVMALREWRQYKNTPAGNLEKQLACYPIGNKMFFNMDMVKQNYGNMMVRLVVRDSAQIPADQPYPIPADKKDQVIKMCVDFFRSRLKQGADLVKDDNLRLQ